MSHEKTPSNHEHSTSVPSTEAKHHNERLKEQIESSAEKAMSSAELEDTARHEVQEQAVLAAEMAPVNNEATRPTVPQPTSKSEKNKSFNTTMHHVRKDLSASERTLSKVIHQPAVEKASEIAGKTIARPSGMLGAAIAGVIGLAFIFGIAKYAGFALSGSEMPLLLLIGLTLGLLSEWVYKALRSLLT